MPPPGYAPCYEALLPRERMRIEPIKEYKHDFNGVRNLLGPTLSLTHTSFTPCPVDTVQVKTSIHCLYLLYPHMNYTPQMILMMMMSILL